MKKIMLGTSDAWSTSHLTQQTSEPAYCVLYCRLSDFKSMQCSLQAQSSSQKYLEPHFLHESLIMGCFRQSGQSGVKNIWFLSTLVPS